jgi:hypothetical protein
MFFLKLEALSNADLLAIPYPGIELFKKSPIYYLPKLWNDLDKTKLQNNQITKQLLEYLSKTDFSMTQTSSYKCLHRRTEIVSGNLFYYLTLHHTKNQKRQHTLLKLPVGWELQPPPSPCPDHPPARLWAPVNWPQLTNQSIY